MSSTPTFITEASVLLITITTAVLSNYYSEVPAHTALAYSYWAGFDDTYGCLGHAH